MRLVMWTWPSIITGTSASPVRRPAQPDAPRTPAAPSAFSARRRERSIVDWFICSSLWSFFHALSVGVRARIFLVLLYGALTPNFPRLLLQRRIEVTMFALR